MYAKPPDWQRDEIVASLVLFAVLVLLSCAPGCDSPGDLPGTSLARLYAVGDQLDMPGSYWLGKVRAPDVVVIVHSPFRPTPVPSDDWATVQGSVAGYRVTPAGSTLVLKNRRGTFEPPPWAYRIRLRGTVGDGHATLSIGYHGADAP